VTTRRTSTAASLAALVALLASLPSCGWTGSEDTVSDGPAPSGVLDRAPGQSPTRATVPSEWLRPASSLLSPGLAPARTGTAFGVDFAVYFQRTASGLAVIDVRGPDEPPAGAGGASEVFTGFDPSDASHSLWTASGVLASASGTLPIAAVVVDSSIDSVEVDHVPVDLRPTGEVDRFGGPFRLGVVTAGADPVLDVVALGADHQRRDGASIRFE
jgi:hypothetical protein